MDKIIASNSYYRLVRVGEQFAIEDYFDSDPTDTVAGIWTEIERHDNEADALASFASLSSDVPS